MEKKIIESNKLIAEFLGIRYHDNDTVSGYPSVLPLRMGVDKVDTFKFHSSWDWLMPVVEKISKMRLKYSNADEYYYPYPRTFGMLDDNGIFMVRLNSEPLFTAPTLIEATYQAVVEFIKGYSPTPEV